MKISELTPTEVLNDEDIFPVVQDGETKSVKRKDLFKNSPTPTEDGDVVNKKFFDEKFEDVKIPIDDKLDENSTNAIQNAAVAKEMKEIKSITNSVHLTYEGLGKPYIVRGQDAQGTCYESIASFQVPYFYHKYNEVTGEKEITPKRTNLPPCTYDFASDGRVQNAKYTCEFSNEAFIVDLSSIDPNETDLMIMPVAEVKQLVEGLGGKFTFSRSLYGSGAGAMMIIEYRFNCSFADKSVRDAFHTEYFIALSAGWVGFMEAYTPITTPIETVSEVIENDA